MKEIEELPTIQIDDIKDKLLLNSIHWSIKIREQARVVETYFTSQHKNTEDFLFEIQKLCTLILKE